MFPRTVIRGRIFEPGLFCAPLAELTHSAFRRLIAELGGCGGQFTEMLSGRHVLHENLHRSPYVRRRPVETRLFYQLMLLPDDPIDRIVGRLEELAPDGLDLNLACYAPVVRQISACSGLFDNIPALASVLGAVRRCWDGPLTVKVRLGHEALDAQDRFAERLRVFEDAGVDAVTLHPRYFEDKFRRRARHELFEWVASRTRLPLIANGDILGPETLRDHAALFRPMAGIMVGRMAIVRPWLFASWSRPAPVDHRGVWIRLFEYIREDFAPAAALKRVRLFSKYFARNFLFGHYFETRVHNAATLDDARERAEAFFAASPELLDEPSLLGL